MTTYTLKSITGKVLFEGEDESLRKVVEAAVAARADLRDAYLTGANLRGANLTGAYLRDAYLRDAYLTGANLTGAYLRDAYLRDAYLTGANLTGAYLRDAYLTGANLTGAEFDERTQWPFFSIVPDTGVFTGWKKARDARGNVVILQLEIPAEAGRVNSTGRKCRAEFARVVAMFQNGESYERKAFSSHNSSFGYVVGQVATPDKYDPDFRVECSHGIHFFITRKEAEAY